MLPLLALACVRGVRSEPPTVEDEAVGLAAEAIVYGGVAAADVAGVHLERTPGGAARATRRPRGRTDARPAYDGVVEEDLRGRLSMDPLVGGVELDVDVDEGRARLTGDVDDASQAGRAIRLALETPGVREVESRLTWPAPRDVSLIRRRFQAVLERAGPRTR